MMYLSCKICVLVVGLTLLPRAVCVTLRVSINDMAYALYLDHIMASLFREKPNVDHPPVRSARADKFYPLQRDR